MSDLIDRQEAIKVLKRLWEDDLEAYGVEIPESFDAERANEAIRNLPSAEPKRGKWIPHSEISREYFGAVLVNVRYEYWFCDTCGYRVENGQPMYNFCPNCGIRMED